MVKKGKHAAAAMVWALQKYGDVGPRTFRALMARYKTLSAIHSLELDELDAIDGLSRKRCKKIYKCTNRLDESEEFFRGLTARDIYTSTVVDDDYPTLLEELNDPPPIFFYRGSLVSNDEKTIAIVGTSNAGSEGIAQSVLLTQSLAEADISIVSGLHAGIESSVHIGAIKAGGKTYAVLDSGFDHVLPEENQPLAVEIVKQGALISEYPPETEYSDNLIEARNRLIVGLSGAVVIGELSGDSQVTLDIAKFCHDLGKLVFVLVNPTEEDNLDTAGIEKVINLGGIPILPDNAVEMITKSLV